MVLSKHWIFFRFILPVMTNLVAEVPHFLWPGSGLARAILFILLMICPVFNLVMGLLDAPPHELQERLKKYRHCVAVWQASEFLAAAVLTFTEVGAAATFNDPHPDQWFDILVVGLLFFGPYAALVLLARNRLQRCYAILVEDLQEGK